MIKGYEARNDMGQTLGDIGIPDIQTIYPHGSEGNPDLAFHAFPNPAAGRIELVMVTNYEDEMAKLWVVPATISGTGNELTAFMAPP